MPAPKWPRLPNKPEDLPKIRELLTAEEYEKLLKRLGWFQPFAPAQPFTSSPSWRSLPLPNQDVPRLAFQGPA